MCCSRLSHPFQPLQKNPLSFFSPQTWGQSPSLFLNPSEHPQLGAFTVAAFSQHSFIPSDPTTPRFLSSLPGQVQMKIKAKHILPGVCFNLHLLPLLQTPPFPALLLWEFWPCGDGTTLASRMCPGCGVNTGAALGPRLAVVTVLALSHWTWDTTKGEWPG